MQHQGLKPCCLFLPPCPAASQKLPAKRGQETGSGNKYEGMKKVQEASCNACCPWPKLHGITPLPLRAPLPYTTRQVPRIETTRPWGLWGARGAGRGRRGRGPGGPVLRGLCRGKAPRLGVQAQSRADLHARLSL